MPPAESSTRDVYHGRVPLRSPMMCAGMNSATVLTVSSRALLDACDALGIDTEALLAAAALTRAEVSDPDARIPVDKMAALWREAHARAGDPDLALHAAEALPFGAYAV